MSLSLSTGERFRRGFLGVIQQIGRGYEVGGVRRKAVTTSKVGYKMFSFGDQFPLKVGDEICDHDTETIFTVIRPPRVVESMSVFHHVEVDAQ